MELKVDTIVNPALFEDEDTELVELAIAPEDEDKYPFVRPSSAPADLMDSRGELLQNGRIWTLMSEFRLTLHI